MEALRDQPAASAPLCCSPTEDALARYGPPLAAVKRTGSTPPSPAADAVGKAPSSQTKVVPGRQAARAAQPGRRQLNGSRCPCVEMFTQGRLGHGQPRHCAAGFDAALACNTADGASHRCDRCADHPSTVRRPMLALPTQNLTALTAIVEMVHPGRQPWRGRRAAWCLKLLP